MLTMQPLRLVVLETCVLTIVLLRYSHKECNELGALLLSYTRQIALGVGYLSLKQYVHRDLAARNILVSGNGICKVTICNESYIPVILSCPVYALIMNVLNIDC